jgi:hypothetical protein
VAIYRNARKVVNKGADWAAIDEPEDAHLVQTIGPVASYVITEEERPKRITFGVAHLAEEKGKKRKPVDIGLPKEGSALLFGAPGSGKTVMGHRMMLNTEKEDPEKGILATKWVITSIKSRDIAGVVAGYFRSIGAEVNIWDLNGNTSDTLEYGDPIRWAPHSLCTDHDKSKKMARRIIMSGRGTDSQNGNNKFWLDQCTNVIACCMLAGRIIKAPYKMVLKFVLTWDAPEAVDVEEILRGHGDKDGAEEALQVWIKIRMSKLERRPNGTWTEKQSSGDGSVTGDNLSLTLSGLMAEIATQAAYDATTDAKLNMREWVRRPGSAALFLIGNMREPGMTRSLFAPGIGECLTEAAEYANEQEEERLPYQLRIFADELANLAPLDGLELWFATNRSARIQFVAVLQSYAQLEKVYSPQTARIMLDASAATVILSGVNDPVFIGDLSRIGGSQRVELNKENLSMHALIEGQHLAALRPINPSTGKSGSALMIANGPVISLELPMWTNESRYDDRGAIMPQHREVVDELRKKRDPWARRRRWVKAAPAQSKEWITNLIRGKSPLVPPGPVTGPQIALDANGVKVVESAISRVGRTPPTPPITEVPVTAPTASSPHAVAPVARPLIPRSAPALPVPNSSMSRDTEMPHQSAATIGEVLYLDESANTFISASGAQTRVLVGIYGKSAWLARLTGSSKKYNFERAFIDRVKHGRTQDDTSGSIVFKGPLADGIYEWREFCIGEKETNWRSDGFALIREGLIVQITKVQATELLAAQSEILSSP